jgi:hypothetical protein
VRLPAAKRASKVLEYRKTEVCEVCIFHDPQTESLRDTFN